jgi:hypothetical protein
LKKAATCRRTPNLTLNGLYPYDGENAKAATIRHPEIAGFHSGVVSLCGDRTSAGKSTNDKQ